MAHVIAKKGESIEKLLQRFKRLTNKEGTLLEAAKHERFKPHGQKRREKSAAARKRLAKMRKRKGGG